MQFPHVDPIPIPAPVWLMKALSLLTLSLHFFAVQVLIGSLVAVAWLSWRGQARKDGARLTSAAVIARRLPIVMTYVINLGIPPLLFAQVLYGRALYTSSDLIAVLWIAVIPLLMGCYWLLYQTAYRTEEGRPAQWTALGALLIAALVGRIYSTNMTLMLRPEVWQQMYAHTATGLQTPPTDHTLEPRWLTVLCGGLLTGGFWIALHSNLKTIDSAAQACLRRLGLGFAIAGAVIELGNGLWVTATQPAAIEAALQGVWQRFGAVGWTVGLALAVVVASVGLARKQGGVLVPVAGAVASLVAIGGGVIYRDGIRDVTLMGKGFDVWNRAEASNWSVIALFLLLFVVALGVIGWLLSVMKGAKPLAEQVSVGGKAARG